MLNDTLPAIADNIRLDVKYTDMAGSPISVEDIRQGTDFMSAVTLSNISGTSDYSNLALTHIIPSGWEIYNERMVAPETESVAADGSGKSVSKYNYLDIRDDRVLTYFNLRRGETKVFTVRLQATYAGNFILPAVQCEAMAINASDLCQDYKRGKLKGKLKEVAATLEEDDNRVVVLVRPKK